MLAVPPKCAVRDGVMDYFASGVNDFGCDLANGTRYILPSFATHNLPVAVSSTVTWEGELAVNLYRFGLVRLWRRIAAKINSAPSLNCVLVIATQ